MYTVQVKIACCLLLVSSTVALLLLLLVWLSWITLSRSSKRVTWGRTLRQLWGNIEVTLRQLWNNFETTLRQLWITGRQLWEDFRATFRLSYWITSSRFRKREGTIWKSTTDGDSFNYWVIVNNLYHHSNRILLTPSLGWATNSLRKLWKERWRSVCSFCNNWDTWPKETMIMINASLREAFTLKGPHYIHILSNICEFSSMTIQFCRNNSENTFLIPRSAI